MNMDNPFNDYLNQLSGQTIGAMGTYAMIWTDFMTNMAMAGISSAPGVTPPEAARQVRGNAFRAMAEAMEESMRTPQFLEMMRQSVDMMLTWRKQLDGMMTQTRQTLQGTTREDIDTLMQTIRHMERRVLDRLEDVDERLADFESRLDHGGENGHEGRPRRSRRASGRESSSKME